MLKQNRWVLLKHICSSNDEIGFHFDLLLEDGPKCRTWSLQKLPLLDGPVQKIIALPAHNLYWLETEGRFVSAGRGWAYPIDKGFFEGLLPLNHLESFEIVIQGRDFRGKLQIFNQLCKLKSKS